MEFMKMHWLPSITRKWSGNVQDRNDEKLKGLGFNTTESKRMNDCVEVIFKTLQKEKIQ